VDWVSPGDPKAKFPAAKGRYHLYVGLFCPCDFKFMTIFWELLLMEMGHSRAPRTNLNEAEEARRRHFGIGCPLVQRRRW
jgi:hypothetical protein